MSVLDLAEPITAPLDRVYTPETPDTVSPQDGRVATRTDWPQEEFLRWWDATKARLVAEGKIKARAGEPASDYRMSDYLGLNHTLISGWRGGRSKPSVETLLLIAPILKEDPRELLVLAGWVSAISVGLLDDDVTPGIGRPDLPQEFLDLLSAYWNPELTDEDREIIRRHVSLLAQGVLADLAARHGPRRNGSNGPDRTNSRARAG